MCPPLGALSVGGLIWDVVELEERLEEVLEVVPALLRSVWVESELHVPGVKLTETSDMPQPSRS
jgi:hypothetical protein